MVSAAARRDFSFSSLTLGLAVLSAPSVRVAYPQVSAPEASPEHRSVLVVEAAHGGGRGWGSIEPTRVVALPSAGNEAPTQGERGCNGLLPFGHHSLKALCAMVVQASSTCIPMCRAPPSLRPILSGHFLTANLSPLPGSALQTPHSSTQPLSAAVDTLSGWVGRAGVSTLCRGLTLSCSHMLAAVFSPHRE